MIPMGRLHGFQRSSMRWECVPVTDKDTMVVLMQTLLKGPSQPISDTLAVKLLSLAP